MAKFTLEIRCDNAAFVGDPQAEIARSLRDLADRLERIGLEDGFRVRDANGNHVGVYTFAGDGT